MENMNKNQNQEMVAKKSEEKKAGDVFYIEGTYIGKQLFVQADNKTGEVTKTSAKLLFLIPTKSNADGSIGEACVSQIWATSKKAPELEVNRFRDLQNSLSFGQKWLLKVADSSFGENQKDIVAVATAEQYELFKKARF